MQILKINSKNFNKVVEPTTKAIKQGEVVVCPTDTVYGLLADATNKKAVKKVFKIKKRSIKKPLPVFVEDLKMAKKCAKITKKQEKFLKKIWPGQITVILPVSPALCAGETGLAKGCIGHDKKIGLRMPDYKLVKILLKKLNNPLTGTSANISEKPASTKIKEVISQFEKEKIKPDLIIDTGNLPKSEPSTVVDLTGEKLRVLREGKVRVVNRKPPRREDFSFLRGK